MPEEMEEIEVPTELMEAVKQLIQKRPKLGYKDPDDFIRRALERYMEEEIIRDAWTKALQESGGNFEKAKEKVEAFMRQLRSR